MVCHRMTPTGTFCKSIGGGRRVAENAGVLTEVSQSVPRWDGVPLPLMIVRVAGLAGALLLIVCCSGTVAAGKWACWKGKGKVTRNLPGIRVTVTPTTDRDAIDWPGCHVLVQDASKRVILSEDDASFNIIETRLDLNEDGNPDLILEGFSGGAHCCWTFYFISLGPNARLITKFENQRDFSLLTDKRTGRTYIDIEDGAFDYFDGLCHACTPFPVVFLRIEGDRIVDIHLEHLEDYDEIIQENRKALTAEDIAHVISMKTNPSESESSGVRESVTKILMIVFAYLYSGREVQAKQELRAMWPQFDQERMWNSIQDCRREGILRYVYHAPATQSATQPQ